MSHRDESDNAFDRVADEMAREAAARMFDFPRGHGAQGDPATVSARESEYGLLMKHPRGRVSRGTLFSIGSYFVCVFLAFLNFGLYVIDGHGYSLAAGAWCLVMAAVVARSVLKIMGYNREETGSPWRTLR